MIGNDDVTNDPVVDGSSVGDQTPAPVEEVAAAPEDAFAAAFDRMTAPGEEPREEPPPPVEPVMTAPEEPTSPPEEEPTSPPVEEPKLSDEEILSRFADLVKNSPPQQAAPPPPPQQTQPQAQEQPQYYSPEDIEILKKYEEEWPDVAKAEALRRSAEYKQLVGYVFQEVAKEFSPLVEQLQSLATRTHLTDLQSTVPDYADVREKVIDWAQNQPPYLRAAYNHVIQQGTVDEVSDLIARFRTETQAVTPAPSQPRRAKTPDLPPATKQAVAALAPVSSKRSAVVQGIDAADFDSAFESFANRRAS